MRRYISLFLIAALAAWSLMGCQPSEQQQSMQDPTVEGQAATSSSMDPVATGRFVNKGGQETTGAYRIEQVEDDLRLVLADDFATDEGPDLHVVLTPVAVSAVSGENAMADDAALVVGPLEAQSGAQQFDLPDDVDLGAFRSVLIHCIEFSHLYGAAPLR